MEAVPGLRPHRLAQGRQAEKLPHRREPQERDPAEPVRRHHGRQRLSPSRAAQLGGHPSSGEGPRCRLEDELVAGGAMLQHVLEVVAQPPQPLLLDAVDGGSGQRLVVVVDELGERVLGVAHPGPEERVRFPGLLLERRLLEERHDPAPERPSEQVVEVLGGTGVGPGVALHPLPCDGHVPPGEDEPEQAVDAVHRPLPPLLEGPIEQRPLPVVAEQVEAQAQAAQGLPGLGEGPLFDRRPREGQVGPLAPQPPEGGEGLVAQDLVLLPEARQEEVHRLLRGDAGQGRGDPATDLHVLRLLPEEVPERLHDSLTAADEHVPRRIVERSVAEKRHERRHEEVLRPARPARRCGSPPAPPSASGSNMRGTRRARKRAPPIPPSAAAACRRPSAAVSRVSAARRSSAASAASTSSSRALAARIAAAVVATRGSRSSRYCRISSAARSPRIAASACTAAARTSALASFRRPSTTPAQRSRSSGRAASSAWRARTRTLSDWWCRRSGRHQPAAFQGLEEVDGVEHPLLVGVREVLDQGLDRRGVGEVGPHRGGLDLPPLDAATERDEVLAPRPDRGQHPQRRHRQARVADLLPVEPQAPGLDEDEGEQRRQPLGEAVHRHVHEGLGPVLEGGRQREEQDLPGGLVERVAQRRVEDPRRGRGPEGRVQQHDEAGRPQAHREDEEGEAHAQVPVDPARQGHLDEEADGREVERDLGQELGQVVRGGAPLERLRRHVQLLLDEAGADRGEGDHEGDDLQVAGLPQEPEGLLAPDALLLGGDGAAPPRRRLPPDDQRDEPGAERAGWPRCTAAGSPSPAGSPRGRSARPRSCRPGSTLRR